MSIPQNIASTSSADPKTFTLSPGIRKIPVKFLNPCPIKMATSSRPIRISKPIQGMKIQSLGAAKAAMSNAAGKVHLIKKIQHPLLKDEVVTNSQPRMVAIKPKQESTEIPELIERVGYATTGETPTITLLDILKAEIDGFEDCSDTSPIDQICVNPLPPFVPEEVPEDIQRDPRYTGLHTCHDCGDVYALESSLKMHLDRRSVYIKFPCTVCNSKIIFFNRCSLLAHIRSHADNGETVEVAKAVVTPIPKMYLNRMARSVTTHLNEPDELDSNVPEINPLEMVEVCMDASGPETKEETNQVKVKCLDCDEEFDTLNDRIEHLTNGDKVPEDLNHCTKCGMRCPSKCSLKAHQRIHIQVSPYVCPECGDSPDPYWENFQRHLRFKCFHFSRAIGYKCPVCNLRVKSSHLLADHVDNHAEKYAKCSICPRAFKSTATFAQHAKIVHRGWKINAHLLRKCGLCELVFTTQEQLQEHKATHLSNIKSEYIFNCMQCGKATESKMRLLEHMKLCHAKTYKSNIQEDTTPKKTAIVASTFPYKKRVECILCNCTFQSHQGYSVHISRTHGASRQPCNYCHSVILVRKEMVTHGKKHIQGGGFMCLLCYNKPFNDAVALEKHILYHVERLKFSSFCPICDQSLQSMTDAMDHLRLEHSLSKRSATTKQVETETKYDSFHSCSFCYLSFETEANLTNHMIKNHNVRIINLSENNTPKNTPDAPEPKRQKTMGNSCAKCNFTSSDRSEFKKHILTHKDDKSTYQCQECGLCFVLEGSLCKHLRLHRITDVKKYIGEEGTNFVPTIQDTSEIVTMRNELECTVCLTTFPTDAALKTHMRSHGMAFIQAKKSGS